MSKNPYTCRVYLKNFPNMSTPLCLTSLLHIIEMIIEPIPLYKKLKVNKCDIIELFSNYKYFHMFHVFVQLDLSIVEKIIILLHKDWYTFFSVTLKGYIIFNHHIINIWVIIFFAIYVFIYALTHNLILYIIKYTTVV